MFLSTAESVVPTDNTEWYIKVPFQRNKRTSMHECRNYSNADKTDSKRKLFWCYTITHQNFAPTFYSYPTLLESPPISILTLTSIPTKHTLHHLIAIPLYPSYYRQTPTNRPHISPGNAPRPLIEPLKTSSCNPVLDGAGYDAKDMTWLCINDGF
jgi:hypothetical protein